MSDCAHVPQGHASPGHATKTRKQNLNTGVDNLPASSTALHAVAPMQHRGCALVACTGVGAAQQAAIALHKASFRGQHTLIAAPTSKIPPNWDETLYGASPLLQPLRLMQQMRKACMRLQSHCTRREERGQLACAAHRCRRLQNKAACLLKKTAF